MFTPRHAALVLALLLGGCAQNGDDFLWPLTPATDADRRAYAAQPNERFPIAEVDLSKLPPKYRRQMVRYSTPHKPGTVVVDPGARYLYLVKENGRALRYGVEVGREGLEWSGSATIARRAEWPTWTPPAEMIARDPKVAPFAAGMPGGPENPLGARALYLYQGGKDTLYRIHGGGAAGRIGEATSSGCVRLLDQDAIDLYRRVPNGAEVVVLPGRVASTSATRL
jgi:lipoprotein-anchoring transpeptidase ErfK/SrfK